jgi:dTDP-4-dehydrorhamnose reductase
LQNKEKIDVVSDQTGSPTYAMDLAEATLKAIDQNPEFTGVHRYHFSNSGETSWYGLAVEIKKLNHSSCRVNPLTTADYPTAAARPKYTVLSGEKIKKEFNLTPRSWESALEACLKKIK